MIEPLLRLNKNLQIEKDNAKIEHNLYEGAGR